MIIFNKNEFWMIIFSIGLLYWLFNPNYILSLIMIIPVILAVLSKK